MADRFTPFGTTIFTEMTLLANKHGAVNLAQGFPDFDGPEFIKEAAARAMGLGGSGRNQYARMFGLPELNAAIAAGWMCATGETIDPETQVTVTSGCTEAICAAMMGLVNPGDEVVLFEPYYDSYRASVAMAGGVPKFVTLRAPDERHDAFWFDDAELERAFTAKTRVVLVNTPQNPTGKVFTREELSMIAALCMKHDVIALVDVVYEHLVYDEKLPHVHLATLPGMRERTLTLSSLGKTFSLTGWKIGWAIGPAALNKAVRAAHQFMTFATATPLQVGAAAAVTMEGAAREYVDELVRELASNRAFLSGVLREVGFKVYEPAGAYFIMVDWTGARAKGDERRLGERFADDVEFCRWLTSEVGVAAIPPSVFYENKQHGRMLARFAFCKKRGTLESAAERLRRGIGVGV
jgi:aspartate/methionine/tyrosine aminotransferase